MQSWNLNDLDVKPHNPQVLESEDEGRAIVINLPAGEVGSSRVDLQACKLEYSIVSPK